MAKELPYFKFEPNQWENGNIQIFTREEKGLFIDLCSMYWSRLGDLPLKLAVQKLCAGNATAFDSLIEENIFAVKEGLICIDFLNEQLFEFENASKKNSKNALEGWEKRRASKALSNNANASISQSENNAIREEKKREDKIKEIYIPEWTEFLTYGLEKEKNVDHSALKMKYEAWKANDWKDGNGRQIKNWKSSLLHTMPYIQKNNSNSKSKQNTDRNAKNFDSPA